MNRNLKLFLCLSILTIAAAENFTLPAYQSLAEERAIAATCNVDMPLENQAITLLDQARSALDNKDEEIALRSLQEALPLILQLNNKRAQADIIEQWLLATNEGYPISRFQRLIQQSNVQQQPAQIQSLLDQLLQIANRLTAETSFVKTRGLSAIAHHYATLNQPQTAERTLNQARQAARFIQGPLFKANALIDVAEGYSAIAKTQTAQVVLAQVEQALRQVPPNTSEPIQLTIWPRVATTYAQIGNYAQANRIVARLPKNSEPQSVAQRGIAQTYITAGRLDIAHQLTQTIAAPSQKIPALAQLAVAYNKAQQSEKANILLQQAVQLAQSQTVARDPILQEFVFKGLVESHLQMGQRDEALRLAQTFLKTAQAEALKSVISAYAQAGEKSSVERLLSERLSAIRANPNDWEQNLELPGLLQMAVDTQQFNWISKQWSEISGIGYGFQDWQVEKLAKAYAQTGQYQPAVEWVNQLPIDNRYLLKIKLLSAIAQVAHNSGETAQANQLLQQALETIDPMVIAYQKQIDREGGDISDLQRLKPQSLALIAVVYAQMNQAEKASQLLEQAIALDVNMSDPSYATPADNPFAFFTNAEQYVGALQLALGTPYPEVRESRLQTSAMGLLKQNRFDLVLPIAEQLTGADRQTQLLLAIAQRYGELQQVEKALPLLAKAFEVAKTVPGEESQVDRLGTDGATVIEKDNDRGSLLQAIAIQYARFNQSAQAMKVVNALQEPQTRGEVLQQVKCIANR